MPELRNFYKQKTAAHDQLFRTLGVPASYKNGAGTIKNIIVIFRERAKIADDGLTRMAIPYPEIRVRSSDIDDQDTDTARFTINSIEYKVDAYLDDGLGLMDITLRL